MNLFIFHLNLLVELYRNFILIQLLKVFVMFKIHVGRTGLTRGFGRIEFNYLYLILRWRWCLHFARAHTTCQALALLLFHRVLQHSVLLDQGSLLLDEQLLVLSLGLVDVLHHLLDVVLDPFLVLNGLLLPVLLVLLVAHRLTILDLLLLQVDHLSLHLHVFLHLAIQLLLEFVHHLLRLVEAEQVRQQVVNEA